MTKSIKQIIERNLSVQEDETGLFVNPDWETICEDVKDELGVDIDPAEYKEWVEMVSEDMLYDHRDWQEFRRDPMGYFGVSKQNFYGTI